MFATPYGSFDGSSWEDLCQIIFKRKYMDAGYQRIMASPGDFGIEGYTKDGKTFQCYCPNVNMDNKSLYEKQRNKLTEDIKKLKVNEKELLEILGGVKLNTWTLVTPHIGHRDLITHSNTKRDLVLTWNLPFIDKDNFQVLVHEASDYAIEIGEYYNHNGKKFLINPIKSETSDDKLVEWQKTQIDLVNNAISKNKIRVSSIYNKNISQHANTLTDETVRHYLNGESILRIWQNSQPENHQRFIELLSSVEEELLSLCMLNEVEPNAFVKQITDYIEKRITSSFSYLDESTVVRLKNYSIAFWLLRCPLYFEIRSDEK